VTQIPRSLRLLAGYDLAVGLAWVVVRLVEFRMVPPATALGALGKLAPAAMFLLFGVTLYRRDANMRVGALWMGGIAVAFALVLLGGFFLVGPIVGADLGQLDDPRSAASMAVLHLSAPKVWWAAWWGGFALTTGLFHLWVLTRPRVRHWFLGESAGASAPAGRPRD
jgi:hypothetical protein